MYLCFDNDMISQDHSKGSSYVEVPLAWICSWDEPSRQRIVADRIFSHKGRGLNLSYFGVYLYK